MPVRGTTMKPLISMLRKAGAKEIHIRVASPPIKHCCYMGINLSTKEELIANHYSPDEMAKFFGADSLQYLSLAGLRAAVQNASQPSKERGHCTGALIF